MKQLLNFILKVAWLKSLYFNLHYLPLKQGLRCPIILAPGVKLLTVRGEVLIKTQGVSYGMIKIGFKHYGFQTNNDKTILENNGGKLIFNGRAEIGQGTAVIIGKNGNLYLKKGVCIGGNSKIICYDHITIGINSRFAWDVTIMDTDFHKTLNLLTNELNEGKEPIVIGDHNWIGFGTTILKGTCTPDFCVIAANSLLLKGYKCGDHCLLGGHPAVLKKEHICRDFGSFVE
jgi:acetyltransferase-like isoleucine patch superfamily enzyme